MYRFNDRNHNISNPLNEPKLFQTVHEHKECCKEQEGAPLNVLQQGLPLCVYQQLQCHESKDCNPESVKCSFSTFLMLLIPMKQYPLRHGGPAPKALHQSGLTMGKVSVHGEPKFSEGQPRVFTNQVRVKQYPCSQVPK